MKHLLLLSTLLLAACSWQKQNRQLPATSQQALVVLTNSVNTTHGFLYRFEKKSQTSRWVQVGNKIPVALGNHGLGWGKGLNGSINILNFPVKREGDGRSPAGIFNLGFVFGCLPASQMTNLKMPYLYIDKSIECIDDTNSQYYNKIVSRLEIQKTGHVDWVSSEQMKSVGVYYELGVVVEHNFGMNKNNFGSCIFLHNWANPAETTSGCTSMSPSNMKDIAFWLDKDKNPVLIQLTHKAYLTLQQKWNLPAFPKR